MDQKEVLSKFKLQFYSMADHVIGWCGLCSNTIEITLDSGMVYVFIYYDKDNWRLLTRDRYYAELYGELPEKTNKKWKRRKKHD